jgi:antitoxin (DNA-binding transcriptional repressor) of toxin-antitoxin stability system
MRRVMTSDLKAHLSAYLAAVRGGETIIVCDRKTPIARLEPIDEQQSDLVIRPATRKMLRLDEFEPIRLDPPVDVLKWLSESRD